MQAADAHILKFLASLESEFFSALHDGLQSFGSFDGAWKSFNSQVGDCADQLQEETKAKIYSFAQTAAAITAMLVDVDTGGDNIQYEMLRDMTEILRKEFKNLSIHDKTTPSAVQMNVSYVPSASKWLLDNLHNPYPSSETRLKIAASTNSSPKDIDNWFIDARKRIGWNQLRKEHFPKRGDLIKAATLFFKPSQSTISASKSLRSKVVADRYLDFAQQFVQMEERARELYSSKLVPSAFASELEKVESSIAQRAEISNQDSMKHGRLSHKSDPRSSYPSPEYSPGPVSRSLSPTLSPTASNRDTSDHTSRKRKRSISPTSTLSDSELIEQSVPRPLKRNRINAAESLPSPAASADDSLHEESTSDASKLASPTILTRPSGKRKRALSDVDEPVQKRPHTIPRAQHLHFDDPIRPAELLAGISLEDLLADVLGRNNEYAYGAAPATSPSFDEINQFGVEFQYAFPYEIMPDDGFNRDESESPGDTPELENVALPQPQLMTASNVNDMPAFDVGNVTLNYDIPLPWGDLEMPSATTGAEFWPNEQAFTNSESMLQSGWPGDSIPIGLEGLPPQMFWTALEDLPNNTTDYCGLPATSSGTLFPTSTSTKTSELEQLSYDDKFQKINQLQQMLAQVEVLRSELAL